MFFLSQPPGRYFPDLSAGLSGYRLKYFDKALGSRLLRVQLHACISSKENLRTGHFFESTQEVGGGGLNDVRNGHHGISCYHSEAVLSTVPARNLMSGESLESDC